MQHDVALTHGAQIVEKNVVLFGVFLGCRPIRGLAAQPPQRLSRTEQRIARRRRGLRVLRSGRGFRERLCGGSGFRAEQFLDERGLPGDAGLELGELRRGRKRCRPGLGVARDLDGLPTFGALDLFASIRGRKDEWRMASRTLRLRALGRVAHLARSAAAPSEPPLRKSTSVQRSKSPPAGPLARWRLRKVARRASTSGRGPSTRTLGR